MVVSYHRRSYCTLKWERGQLPDLADSDSDYPSFPRRRDVIPAKAERHSRESGTSFLRKRDVIPAFAGMTSRFRECDEPYPVYFMGNVTLPKRLPACVICWQEVQSEYYGILALAE